MSEKLGEDAYFRQTHRPLVCLAFLMPWVMAYEVGTLVVGTSADTVPPRHVVAYLLLEQFINLFGATALYLPGLALVAILLAWHVAARDRWSFRFKTLLGMLAESALLALPLVLFNQLLASRPAGKVTSWSEDLVLSVGAGIYEELLFRLICITLLSILLVDLLKIQRGTALVLMVVISSLVFAAHHYPPLGSDPWHLASFLFRAIAGGYLATLFVVRGFGIAAGCHIVYDLLVVTWTAIHA
jgi:hypothetical protein